MTEKNGMPSPGKDKDSVAFFLATVCASPFVYVVVESLINHHKFGEMLILSVFLMPLFLLGTICGPIFIILAWIKSPHWCRPLLILYLLAIAAYWTAVAVSDPW